MADQEKEILEEEMEQDLSDAEELKEEETENEEPVSREDKKAAKKQAKLNKKEDSYKYDVFKTQNTVNKATSLVPAECKMSFFKKIIHKIKSFFKFNF